MVRVSKFYKEAKNGRFLRYLHEDTRTLYETFRRGVKESSEYDAILLSFHMMRCSNLFMRISQNHSKGSSHLDSCN